MFKVTRLLNQAILFAVGVFLAGQPLASKPASKAPLVLCVWPDHVSARHNHPIYLHVAIENVTYNDAYIRLWFTPVPFGPKTDLHCLLLQCRNLKTNKEVRYTWSPPGKTIADAQGMELPDKIPSRCFIGATLNLGQFCELPPGDYALTMQYDTTFIPRWIRPDKRAWHGVTNKVEVRIHVSN